MAKFYQLRSDKVLTTFNIQPVEQCEHLNAWMNTEIALNDFEEQTIDLALKKYSELGRGWNEEELKMHFISPVLSVADLNEKQLCKTFFERPLSGVINNYELNVVCDCLIASYNVAGLPEKPYFFLQEFKQAQRFGRTDPEGQVLVAMMLAQEQNKDDRPIYGCFVIERQWFFTTLLGRAYCVSKAFDATDKEDLIKVIATLRQLKNQIRLV